MACLVETNASLKDKNNLAKIIAGGNEVSDYDRDLAYHMLACNNGNVPLYESDGKTISKLYSSLRDYFSGDIRMATLAKSYIYTSDFVKKHPEYYKDGNIIEPDINMILDDVYGVDIEKYIADTFKMSSDDSKIKLTDEQLYNMDQFYKNRIYRSVLNVTPYDSDVQQFYNIVNSRRNKYVEEQLLERPDADRYDLENEFNHKFLDQQINEIRNGLQDIWNIIPKDGVALNPIDDKESDLYKIYEVRCNILNTLDSRRTDPNQLRLLLNIVKNYITGQDVQLAASSILQYHLDFLENTDFVGRLLEKSGYLKKNAYGTFDKKEINRALQDFRRNMTNEINVYINPKNNKIYSKFEKFLNGLENLFKSVFFGVSYFNKLLAYTPTITAGITLGLIISPSVLSFVVGAIAGKAVGRVMSIYSKETFGESFSARKTFHKNAYNLISAMACCDIITQYEGVVPLNHIDRENLAKALFSDNHISDPLKRSLVNILDNLKSQEASLKSKGNKNMIDSAQQSVVKSLIRLCDDAINHNLQNRENSGNKFFYNYLTTAKEQIDRASIFLNDFQKMIESDSYNAADVNKFMFIKTDVIGAYRSVLYNNILPNVDRFGLSGFNTNGELSGILNYIIGSQLSEVERKFNNCLDQLCNNETNKFFEKTVAKSINPNSSEYRQFRQNMTDWMKSTAIDGSRVPILSEVLSARTNLSPFVRMVTSRLKEIDTKANIKANELTADLEYLRTQQRFFTDRVNPFNVLSRYCEKDSDNKYTGNYISDINRGQYVSDLFKEKKFLYEKYGIVLFRGSPQFLGTDKMTPEEQWAAYNTDLVKWMAGATRDEDGNYSQITEDTKPRLYRRYKAQYYLDKINILGKEGCELLESLNRDISEIQKRCLTDVTYVNKNGEVVSIKVPIIAKLTDQERIRLKTFMNRKSLLSSSYYFETDNSGEYITKIDQKIEHDQQLAARFFKWETKKQEYYSERNTEESKTSDLYDGVLSWYDQQIENETDETIKNQLKQEKNRFIKDSTIHTFSDKFMSHIKKGKKKEYDLNDERVVELLQLYGTRNAVRKHLASDTSKRTLDLNKVGSGVDTLENIKNTKSVWQSLTKIDKRIAELKEQIGYEKIENEEDSSDSRKLKYKDLITVEDVPFVTYNSEGNLIDDSKRKSFLKWLTSLSVTEGSETVRITNNDVKYRPKGLFSTPVTNSLLVRPSLTYKAYQLFDEEDLYEDVPTGIFSRYQSSMIDENFDNSSEDYFQINKEFSQNGKRVYDNTEKYNKIKDDEFYQKCVELTRKVWENYGITPKNNFQMVQKEASIKDLFGRAVSQPNRFLPNVWNATKEWWKDLYIYNSRDLEVVDNIITRADGTVVDTIPIRWVNSVESNNIEIDLVHSISVALEESLKYQERQELAPLMEAFYFKATGGYSSDYFSESQASSIREEINRTIYGRTTTGFGPGGRMTDADLKYAKASKTMRSLLHKRLMSHNWRSVIKNGYDSFCNLLTAAFVGKYILARNLIFALGKLFLNSPTQIIGMNRSKATNMTQALMQLNALQNNISQRYKGQHKAWLTRVAENFSTIEFEFVDYTTKALITESVYNAHRFMYNPVSDKYEFLNESEAEFAYSSSGRSMEEGYENWKNSKITLREMYTQNKKGVAVLRTDTFDYVGIDGIKRTYSPQELVRPNGDFTFETRIRSTLKQMSSTINGMLETEDKSVIAKNYVGAMAVSFRGWMISQSGEFYKTGYDFYNYASESQRDLDVQTVFERCQGAFLDFFNADKNVARKSSNLNFKSPNYDGQFNFATCTIDKGLHVNLLSNLIRNFGHFLQMFLFLPIDPWKSIKHGKLSKVNKFSHLQKMSSSDYYQLRHLAASTHFFLLTIALTCMALMWYEDGDDDDPTKAYKSLIYSSMLASISERFPSIGGLPFILNVADIVNAATVGVTLFDDMNYVMNLAGDLIGLIQETIDGKRPWLEDLSSDATMHGYLINGSFKGKTRLQRDVTRALPIFNFDTLPWLIGMNAVGKTLPGDPDFKWFKDMDWTELNLNYYKSTSEEANISSANWYRTIIPVKQISDWLQNTPFRISKKKKERVSGGSGATGG